MRQDVDYFVPAKTATHNRLLLTSVSGCIQRRSTTAVVSPTVPRNVSTSYMPSRQQGSHGTELLLGVDGAQWQWEVNASRYA